MVSALLTVFAFGGMSAAAADEYEILVDNGFEEMDDSVWEQYYLGVVDFTGDAYEGESCLIVTDRLHKTDVVRQYITDQLNFYGPGSYQVSAWVKLALPEGENIEIQAVVGAYMGEELQYKQWFTTPFFALSDTEWTQITATIDMNWDGILDQAEFYFITNEEGEAGQIMCADLMIDSCSLVKAGYEGDPYGATAEEPTQEPAEEPTSEPAETTQAPTAKPTEQPTQAAPTGSSAADSDDAETESNNSKLIGGILIAAAVILVVGCVVFVIVGKKRKKK